MAIKVPGDVVMEIGGVTGFRRLNLQLSDVCRHFYSSFDLPNDHVSDCCMQDHRLYWVLFRHSVGRYVNEEDEEGNL